MKHFFEKKTRLVGAAIVFFAVVCCLFGSMINIRSEIKSKRHELEQLENEYNELLQENEENRHLLQESDIREQYEYQARELGFGYSDEIKVIDITPGS